MKKKYSNNNTLEASRRRHKRRIARKQLVNWRIQSGPETIAAIDEAIMKVDRGDFDNVK